MNKNSNVQIMALSVIIAGVLIAGTIYYVNKGEVNKNVLSAEDASKIAVDYINANFLPSGNQATLTTTTEENGLYKFHIKVADKEYDSYVTKDGKLLFPEAYDISPKEATGTEQQQQQQQQPAKSDRPDLKLFVMSYCPYGLQMEKAFLPVYDLLKSKADLTVHFVSYIMHGKKELDENLLQYCMQKENPQNFPTYLRCFLEDGNSDRCLSAAGINRSKLSACIDQTDSQFKLTESFNNTSTWLGGTYPPFGVEKELNLQYAVQGSPTVVLNGLEVSLQRSPEEIKKAICAAFNNPPEECSQTLSTDATSPGFGAQAASQTQSDASCGG